MYVGTQLGGDQFSKVGDRYLKQLAQQKIHALIADNEGDEDYDPKQLTTLVQDDVKLRIDTLLQAGVLQEKDNQMNALIEYAGGEVKANGKKLGGEEMMGVMAAMP